MFKKTSMHACPLAMRYYSMARAAILAVLSHRALAEREVDATRLHPLLDELNRAYPLTSERNTYSDTYHHMLKLRRLQPHGLLIGHVGWFPLQAFKYYWITRQLAADRLSQGLGPPTTCEIGFGTGHSTSIFLTATTTGGDLMRGGTHHVFDCPACAGGRQKGALTATKSAAWKYLLGAFGNERLRKHTGRSTDLVPALAKEEPSTVCDVFVIDGDHSYLGVIADIKVTSRTSLWTNATVVLFDDVDMLGVRQALEAAENAKLMTIVEQYTGDFNVDQVFSSQHATASGQWRFPKQYHQGKVFVEARFLGRGTVPARDPRTVPIDSHQAVVNISTATARDKR